MAEFCPLPPDVRRRIEKWLKEHPHNDPRIQGPQPRILTRRQWEAMEKMRREYSGDGEDSAAGNTHVVNTNEHLEENG